MEHVHITVVDGNLQAQTFAPIDGPPASSASGLSCENLVERNADI